MKYLHLIGFVLCSMALTGFSEPAQSQKRAAHDLCFIEKGPVDVRLKACKEALTDNPDPTPVYFQRAQLFLLKHDLNNAQADLKILRERAPNHSETFLLSGLIHRFSEDDSSALAAFTQGIERATSSTPLPVLAQLYFYRSEAHSKLKQNPKAQADLDLAIEYFAKSQSRSPKYIQALSNRFGFWEAQKNHPKAIEDLNALIQLMPQSYLNYYSRAQLWLKLKSFDKAIEDLNTVQAMVPDEPWVWIDRAEIWLYKKDRSKALSDLNRALELSVGNNERYTGEVHTHLAWFHAIQQDFKQAETELALASALDAQDPSFLLIHGLIAYLQGHREQALQSLTQLKSRIQASEVFAEWLDNHQAVLWQNRSLSEAQKQQGQELLNRAKDNDLKALEAFFQWLLLESDTPDL